MDRQSNFRQHYPDQREPKPTSHDDDQFMTYNAKVTSQSTNQELDQEFSNYNAKVALAKRDLSSFKISVPVSESPSKVRRVRQSYEGDHVEDLRIEVKNRRAGDLNRIYSEHQRPAYRDKEENRRDLRRYSGESARRESHHRRPPYLDSREAQRSEEYSARPPREHYPPHYHSRDEYPLVANSYPQEQTRPRERPPPPEAFSQIPPPRIDINHYRSVPAFRADPLEVPPPPPRSVPTPLYQQDDRHPTAVHPPRNEPYPAGREHYTGRGDNRHVRQESDRYPPPPDRTATRRQRKDVPLYQQDSRWNQSHPPERSPPINAMPSPDVTAKATAIMKDILKSASINLRDTKEMVANLLPPQTQSTDEARQPVPETVPDVQPRLGDSSYSSGAVVYKDPAPPPPKKPVRKGPDYTQKFFKTAAEYASNWVKKPEDVPSSSSQSSEDNDKVIQLSGSLEVDLEETNLAQVNLLSKYLRLHTRSLRAVADHVPVRIKKRSETEEDDYSALETPRSVRKQFNSRPDPIPGMLSCDKCKLYNAPPVQYRKHIGSDFHKMMEGSYPKIPSYLPRFSMIWCFLCNDFFMITHLGVTFAGHELQDDHLKNKSIFRLKYDDYPGTKYSLLSDLKTTKVKMPTPLKCKYFKPKEALESYKAVYATLCDRNLVID